MQLHQLASNYTSGRKSDAKLTNQKDYLWAEETEANNRVSEENTNEAESEAATMSRLRRRLPSPQQEDSSFVK